MSGDYLLISAKKSLKCVLLHGDIGNNNTT